MPNDAESLDRAVTPSQAPVARSRYVQAASYHDSHAELHRRRATIFSSVPLASRHFAIWHPKSFESNFEDYLKEILRFIFSRDRKKDSGEQTDDQIERLAESVRSYYSQDVGDVNSFVSRFLVHAHEGIQRLVVGDQFVVNTDVLWRLEFHREYIAVTIFLSKIDTGFKEAGNREKNVVDFFERMEHVTTDLQEQFLRVVDLERWDQGPITPIVFSDFFGMALPYNIAGPERVPGHLFADPKSREFSSPHRLATAQARVLDYLRDIYDPFIKPLFAPNAESKGEDIVACYMQRGHSIYLSSLGSRSLRVDQTVPDISPARFVLLSPESEGQGPGRRLSRLIGRLNDLGTTRLASLHNMRKIKAFSQWLRVAELNVAKIERERLEQREDLRSWRERLRIEWKNLSNREAAVGEAVLYRSFRTAYYSDLISSSMPDLGILPIPNWQPYDQFIRRRLLPTVGFLSRAGPRLQASRNALSSVYQFALSDELLELAEKATKLTHELRDLTSKLVSIQEFGDKALKILILYYSFSLAEHVGGALWSIFASLSWSVHDTFQKSLGLLTPESAQEIRELLGAVCGMIGVSIAARWTKFPLHIIVGWLNKTWTGLPTKVHQKAPLEDVAGAE